MAQAAARFEEEIIILFMNKNRTITFISVIFIVIGLSMLVGGAIFAVNQYTFSQTAKSTTGTVTDMLRKISHRSGKSDSLSYKPVVSFVDEKGDPFEFESSVSSNPPRYRKGQTVVILYDPENPQTAYIDDFVSRWMTPLIMAVMSLIFGGVGGGMMLYKYLHAKKIEWLKSNGHRVAAKFVSVIINTSYRVNRRHPFQIIAQAKNPFTQIDTEFKSDNLWSDPTPYMAPYRDQGVSIDVFIDPTKPNSYWVNTDFLGKQI